MKHSFSNIIQHVKKIYPGQSFIPLHEPRFVGKEKQYLNDCIDSTFVSSVGEYVNRFEKMVSEFTGVKYAIATTNGTAALHASLILADIQTDDEVITQALTFIATANSIAYCKAYPIFLDSEKVSLGLCPVKLEEFLRTQTEVRNDGICYNKVTGRKIKACVPMHVFGHPVQMEKIQKLCDEFHITVIEDAAEAIGSKIGDKHVGYHGKMATLSFNGNKIITCGGGGMILTNDEVIAKKAKHITTTAKVPHAWEFVHDEIGYNYRLPNINAALACAQMENLESFLKNKRQTAEDYRDFFTGMEIPFIWEPKGTTGNYWLNAIMLKDHQEQQEFLKFSNDAGVMTRPLWTPMHKLRVFENFNNINLDVAEELSSRLVNIPSSVRTI